MRKYLLIFIGVFIIGFFTWTGLYYAYTASVLGVAKFRVDYGIRAGLVLGISISGLIFWLDSEKENKKKGD